MMEHNDAASPSKDSTAKADSISALTAQLKGNSGVSLSSLYDLTLPCDAVIGETEMSVQDVLKLGPGSIIELARNAGEPITFRVNGTPFARAEVVVVNENYGLRITHLLQQADAAATSE